MSGFLCFCLDKVIQTDYLYRRVFHRSHIGSLSLFLALRLLGVGEEHIYDSLPDVLAAYRKETKQVEEEPTS